MPSQPPPSSPVRQTRQAMQDCAERLGAMVQAVDGLVMELDLGGTAAAGCIAAGVLAELRYTVPDIAHEKLCGQTLVGSTLADMAEQIEAAADRRGYWPLYAAGRSPLPYETQLRALIARLRLVARN